MPLPIIAGAAALGLKVGSKAWKLAQAAMGTKAMIAATALDGDELQAGTVRGPDRRAEREAALDAKDRREADRDVREAEKFKRGWNKANKDE